MTEVVDLTFTDSDDEPELRPSQPTVPTAGAAGLRTPLRRLLALQRRNGGTFAEPEPNPSPPLSPEEIDLLESPELPKQYVNRGELYQPKQRQVGVEEERKKKAPSAAAAAQNVVGPSRPIQSSSRSLAYNPSEYEDEGAEESYEPEYLPQNSPTTAAATAAAAGPGGRKPKRTREEIARDKELKKQQKAAETAARKQASQYNSDRHVLRYMTAILDPELMGSPVGLKIAEAFQQTQAQQAEHERIQYKVASTCLGGGLKAIKWLRKVPTTTAPVQGSHSQHEPYNMNDGGSEHQMGSQSQFASQQPMLIDQEEPHILICFEAEEFVAAVQRDSLTSLFITLQQYCPGHRPHLLVHRLDFILTKKEREDFTRTMGAGGNISQHAFNRRDIDDFISKLSIEAPQVGFRDVASAEEGASHVCSLTRAIARRLLEKNDASKYLLSTGQGNNKKSSQNTASLLASYPVEDPGVRAFLHALCAMPSVGPQIAHAVAIKYGSLGNLMEMLFDPRKSYQDKIRELEFLPRTGSDRVTKVGPKAAKQLMEILTGDNPDAAVHEKG
ncbi:hypothetical protein Ndes2526B_g07593 [Nannochloris sp. 'desiccata']|nr:hypothetical protein KSW81_003262 [Chlorella desiccata (nom. nud.)]KAH7617728.1 putative Crossover junction endonuclease EME1A [Chlorella desiccata (nom. nud.)]